MPDKHRDRAPAVLLLGAPLPPPYGGIAKYLQRAVPFLVSSGFRVHVVQPPLLPSPQVIQPHGQGLMIERLTMPSVSNATAFLLRNLPNLRPLLQRYLLPLVRHPRFAAQELYMLIAWCMAAEQAWRCQRFDLVHAYDYPWVQGAAAVWAASRYRARSVVSTFGEVVPHRAELEQLDAVSPPFRSLSRFVLTRADRVASMTNHCRSHVRYLGLQPERLALVRFVVGMDPYHPGVDAAELRVRYAHEGGPVLLFVGQIRPRKGPQLLIPAMARVLARFPAARLLLVGPDHGFGGTLRDMARRSGVLDAITFTGAVSDDELPVYYGACDLFLFPTLTPIECLGLTFVQAMFAGRPVVATRIAGAQEVITDGKDGFLVEPTTDAFAAKVLEVLELPAESQAGLGARARETAVRQFDEREVLQDLLRLYRGVLSEG